MFNKKDNTSIVSISDIFGIEGSISVHESPENDGKVFLAINETETIDGIPSTNHLYMTNEVTQEELETIYQDIHFTNQHKVALTRYLNNQPNLPSLETLTT